MPLYPPASTGGGTPGGADTNVQYNDGSAFGGDANLLWNKTNKKQTIKNYTGSILTLGDPTDHASLGIDTSDGGWIADGETYHFWIYNYKTISGTKIYSANPLQFDLTDDGSTNYFQFNFSWVNAAGADGTVIFFQKNLQSTSNNSIDVGTDTTLILYDSDNGGWPGTVTNGATLSDFIPVSGYVDGTTARAIDVIGDMSISGFARFMKNIMGVFKVEGDIESLSNLFGQFIGVKDGAGNQFIKIGDNLNEGTEGVIGVRIGRVSGTGRFIIDNGVNTLEFDLAGTSLRIYSPGKVYFAVDGSIGQARFFDSGGNFAAGLTSGKFDTYNKIATVANGALIPYGVLDSTSKAAALSATTILTPTVSGRFLITAYLKVKTAATTSSILGAAPTVTFTDPDDSVAQSQVMSLQDQAGTATIAGNVLNTTAAKLTGSVIINAKAGVAIQIANGYTSVGSPTSMVYSYHYECIAI